MYDELQGRFTYRSVITSELAVLYVGCDVVSGFYRDALKSDTKIADDGILGEARSIAISPILTCVSQKVPWRLMFG